MDEYDFELIVVNQQAVDFGDNLVACVKGIKFSGISLVPKANMQAVGYGIFGDILEDENDGKKYPIGALQLNDDYIMYFDPSAKKVKKNFNVMASMIAYNFQVKDMNVESFKDKMMIFGKAVITGKGDSTYNPKTLNCEEFMRVLGTAFTEVDKKGNPVPSGITINKLQNLKGMYNAKFSDN